MLKGHPLPQISSASDGDVLAGMCGRAEE